MNSTPFLTFCGGIISGPGSFGVQFGDHLRSWDHLRTRTVQANLMLWGNPAIDWHPIKGEGETFSETGGKRWPDGPHSSYADFIP